jgi:beta-glucuronidase
LLHTKPKAFIEDITVFTDIVDDIGIINYQIEIVGLEETETAVCKVNLLDDDYIFNDSQIGTQGSLKVTSPKLWWPQYMSENPGYLYIFEVILFTSAITINISFFSTKSNYFQYLNR